MILTGLCPKCDGRKIAGPHKLVDKAHVTIDLPGFLSATLEAFTCTSCGYTELYADRAGIENILTSGTYIQLPVGNSGAATKLCPSCGQNSTANDRFCSNCGHTGSPKVEDRGF